MLQVSTFGAIFLIFTEGSERSMHANGRSSSRARYMFKFFMEGWGK